MYCVELAQVLEMLVRPIVLEGMSTHRKTLLSISVVGDNVEPASIYGVKVKDMRQNSKITITLTEDQLRELVDLVNFDMSDKNKHNEQSLAFSKRLLKTLWEAEQSAKS